MGTHKIRTHQLCVTQASQADLSEPQGAHPCSHQKARALSPWAEPRNSPRCVYEKKASGRSVGSAETLTPRIPWERLQRTKADPTPEIPIELVWGVRPLHRLLLGGLLPQATTASATCTECSFLGGGRVKNEAKPRICIPTGLYFQKDTLKEFAQTRMEVITGWGGMGRWGTRGMGEFLLHTFKYF